ncbi:MAG: ABC transporter permease, partial [Acidimicrobiia bacterium]
MTTRVGMLRKTAGISQAFLKLGFQQAVSYPLAFVLGQAAAIVPVFIFFFVSQLTGGTQARVGGDYFTFVVTGLVSLKLVDAGLRGLGAELDRAINRGWLEMFLVEPIRWRMLPFGLVQWPLMQGLVGAAITLVIALALGARFRPEGIPVALLVTVLGIGAGLAIGLISGAFKVLAKSGDPVLFLYTLATQVFAGGFFPVDLLPAYLRPISYLLPHTYVLAALRRVLMENGSELSGPSASQAVLMLVAFCAILLPLSLWLYGRALEYGRKLGVLS